MKINNSITDSDDVVELTALIDIIFLLVVYFMGTSTLQAEEADMGITLPASVKVADPDVATFPMEIMVDILPNGQVLLNEESVDTQVSRDMPQFVNRMISIRQSTEMSQTPMFVFIRPAPEAAHQRSMDVLNALAKARVKQISFAMSEEDY
jgi:biopolymer transport protein ExbD